MAIDLIQNNPFVDVPKVASSLNTYDDAQQIADTDCADALNVHFDKNGPTPRNGSSLAWTVPTGETNVLLNYINGITSARKEYAVAIYAPNIYVRDEVNNQWVKINGAYTPSTTYKALKYGYALWNGGTGFDALYFGNGTEDTIKWVISLDYLSTGASTGDTTLTLTSAAQFPASGTVVVKGGSGEFTLVYTSKAGNVLTLSGTVGQTVATGAAVTMAIQDMSSMPKGKLFAKFQGRLFIGNSLGAETTFYYSNIPASVGTYPEDFTVHGTPSGGGFYGFTQGTGEITGIMDFGQYLGVLKGDSFHRFEFTIDSSNTTKIDQVTPLVSDPSLGCPNFRAWIKKNNILHYPSANAGIYSIAPQVTGFQTTISLQFLSAKIQNLYQALNFTNSISAAYQTKIYWSCASGVANDTVLVYDTLRQYWTKYNNWPVADWLIHNNKMYFGSTQDGQTYITDTQDFTDNNNPYTASVTTKRYDFGKPSVPKTMTRVFLQGYISTVTKLYVDVMFNENGTQQVLTYVIDGSKPYCVQPISKAMAMAMLGLPMMGSSDLSALNGLGVFKTYLAIPLRYGFYNIQFKFYTTAAAANWTVTFLGMNPKIEMKAPEEIVIDPTGLPSNFTSSGGTYGSTSTLPTSRLPWYTEVPSGTQDGSNKVFTLAHTPVAVIFLTVNGMTQVQGIEFTMTGNEITFTNAPLSTDEISVSYQ